MKITYEDNRIRLALTIAESEVLVKVLNQEPLSKAERGTFNPINIRNRLSTLTIFAKSCRIRSSLPPQPVPPSG